MGIDSYITIVVSLSRKEDSMEQNDKALSMKLPQSMYDRLKEQADRMNISVASVVRIACTEYLTKAEDSRK